MRTYQIRLQAARDGQLHWAPVWKESRCEDVQVVDCNCQEKKLSGCQRKVFYDDGRNRRLICEVDFEKDCFRYVLEKDGQRAGTVQRTVFPTLQAAVFCLAGCISRNE